MRIGFTTTLVDGFERVEWFGRGPHESYLDRHASARVGLYEGSISEQTVKYVRPQENGNKFQTRWMDLSRKKGYPGNGLLIFGQDSYFVRRLSPAHSTSHALYIFISFKFSAWT
eukprot:Skav233388  [mRNA]  locus=scaffold1038:188482:188823:+ [translate_table: standard]